MTQTPPVTIAGATEDAADASAAIPNDPGIGRSWALDKIGAYDAWETATGEGIVVAVLDTGVDTDHVDLDDNMWVNVAEIAGNGIDDDGNGFVDDVHGWNFSSSGAGADVEDRHSHGTHVAGIVAAEADNGQGGAGVAPDAEIMAVKVLSDSGRGWSSSIANGIDYAVANGAKIINMSLGGSSGSSAYDAAIARAQEAGVIVIAAAGNNGRSEAIYPAHYTEKFDNVLSVAASTKSDKLAGFSNWSESRTTVDLAAPGSGIYSTTPDDNYGNKSGTSMAAPVVAGAAAAIWSARPDWDYLKVIDALMSTVSLMSSLNKETVSNGIVNLAAAMEAVLDDMTPPPVNEAPTLSLRQVVDALAEDADLPAGGLRVAEITVEDDGVGVTILEITGVDASDFEIRDGWLWLKADAALDFETRPELSITITVDDPDIGEGVEAEIAYTLSIEDVDETPPPGPVDPDLPGGKDADAFADLVFWLDGTDAAAGAPRTLSDLSGRGNDAKASASQAAEAVDGGLSFDGGAVYRIADSADINRAKEADAKSLSFYFDTGDDITSRQVLYEQGGATRGLSVTLEGGAVHVSGWNLRETEWGVTTVSADIAAHDDIAVTLVLDGAAGTLSGYLDGLLFGVSDAAGILHGHSDDVGLGGVRGSTRDASGDRVGNGRDGFEGTLYEAAAHNTVLSAADVAALHAGFGQAPADPPAPNTGPEAADDGPFAARVGTEASVALAMLLQNDSDADGDALSVTGLGAVGGGTARIEGDTLVFTADGSGEASVVYTVSDGNGGSDTATVRFDVDGPPGDGSPVPDLRDDDPGRGRDNATIVNLGDKSKAHIFSRDLDDFTGEFRVLNKARDAEDRAINEIAGRDGFQFSTDGGFKATDELRDLYATALTGEGGLAVEQIAGDILRFEVTGRSASDILYFHGAYVEDLLTA